MGAVYVSGLHSNLQPGIVSQVLPNVGLTSFSDCRINSCSAEGGFCNYGFITYQGWQRGMANFVAQGRRGELEETSIGRLGSWEPKRAGDVRGISYCGVQGWWRTYKEESLTRCLSARADGNVPGDSNNGRAGFKGTNKSRGLADTYGSVEREGRSQLSLQASKVDGVGSRGATNVHKEMNNRSHSGVELAAHVNAITSVGNAYVKHLVKVRQNTSYRNAAGCVVVVGSVPLREICKLLRSEDPRSPKPLKVLLVLEDKIPQSDLKSWTERIVYVSEPVLRKVAGVDSAQGLQAVGVLALPTFFCNLEAAEDPIINWVSSPRRVLVLDGIQDPGNLGTLLRTAAAFGWDGVFLLPGCCDPFNEKALRASRGASFRLPVATGHWSQLKSFAEMHRLKLYAADPNHGYPVPTPRTKPEHTLHVAGTGSEIANVVASGSNSFDFLSKVEQTVDNASKKLQAYSNEEKYDNSVVSTWNNRIAIIAGEEALCLILGSEGQGLSENAHQSCERVSIPMPGDFESLNVAVAGGILLYLLNRRCQC